MNVLLSIKPKYAKAIFSGSKKYEFRRTIFRRRDVERIYLYSNSSVQKVVGFFNVGGVLEGSPQEIWRKCHKYGGISKKDFFDYFEDSPNAYAIKIESPYEFSEEINPHKFMNDFTPPQSFCYISNSEINHDRERRLDFTRFIHRVSEQVKSFF